MQDAAMSKGIVTNKQERDMIPIRTMFGNDEDTTTKFNIQQDDEESTRGGLGNNFLEDEKSKMKDHPHQSRQAFN